MSKLIPELPVYLMNEEALQELEEHCTVEIQLGDGKVGVAFDQFTLDAIASVRIAREVGV